MIFGMPAPRRWASFVSANNVEKKQMGIVIAKLRRQKERVEGE
jgi:hypothetical protein